MSDDPFPFEVLEVLGEGAFGAVCVARLTDDPLQRDVAIKVLKAEYAKNPKVLNRTRDEARLLSKLDHPNIVAVDTLIEAEGRPVLVMELVRGLDLKTLLRRSPVGIPASVALEVVRLTCVALDVAYNEATADDGKPLRVIHRDIKPSNMLMSMHGALKVCDFGIATGQFRGRETRTDSVVMGSRPYMAPERLDRSPDTPAVDIYSAGMSLYEILTGHIMPLSVNPASHDRSMSKHLAALSPAGMSDAAAEELRQLIRRMCAYDVGLRPTAGEAAAELARLLDLIDPDAFVTMKDFAQDVVEPLYLERKRIPLKVAVGRLEDKDLLTDAMRGGTSLRSRPTPRSPELKKRPAIFLGAILGIVATLGGIAAAKARTVQAETARNTPAFDRARVHFWFPSDARAQVGSLGLAVPGHLDLPRGTHELDIRFEDGRTITCAFVAKADNHVRFVVDQGHEAISIDDGLARPCRDASR